MLNFLEQGLLEGINPNQLYIMICLRDRVKMYLRHADSDVDDLVKRKLILNGELSAEGLQVLEKIETGKPRKKVAAFTEKDLENIAAYRELFPKGMLPSGQPSRVTVKELEKKFQWFFTNYSYEWEVILKATEHYIETYRQEGFKYMKTSGYFISKTDKGVTTSTLANYCDMMLEGGCAPDRPAYSSHTVI